MEVVMKEELCEKMVEVRSVIGGVMIVVGFEEDVLMSICGYALQSGISLEEKQSFYDELKGEWDRHSADDLVMYLCDFNGHIGGFHGGHGVCQRNL